MKLNLGCLDDYQEGYINIDKLNIGVADLIHDLNEGLPYPNNSVDEILCYNILEHLINDEEMFAEFRRVLKHNGTVELIIPHFSNHMAYHIGHLHVYSWYTFRTDYLNYRYHKGVDANKMPFLTMVDSHISLATKNSKLRIILKPFEWLVNLNNTTKLIYDKFPIFTVHEIYVKLKIKKQGR